MRKREPVLRKASRGLFLFVTAALLSGVVVAPAQADTPPPAPAGADRARVVSLWHRGGPNVKAAAEHALAGTDTDIAAFLTTDLPRLKAIDDRISVDRMAASGGPTIKNAAQQALDSTDNGALLAFLQSGWKTPWSQDLRIRVDQVMATAGPLLHAAAQKALDDGTPPALQAFLDTGWKLPYDNDQRIRVDQIMADAGPEVRKSAQEALDAGTADAYAQFLDHDRAIAEARDLETSTVKQLAGAAKDAGDEALKETEAAKEASARAVTEAQLAKQAAQAAAEAGSRAAGDAAAAAREAVGAANAAISAARVAAGAAARAATAATLAGNAASRAYHAAADAELDGVHAANAHDAANQARDAAVGAQQAAVAAGKAKDAVLNAQHAAQDAAGAGNLATSAAQDALDAANHAANAGANASAARRAAATAQANANRANRAAAAAGAFADAAAAAAGSAQDAANRAATDANAAADAADLAAQHAGQAADAANQATLHANGATQAAQAAVTAANQAQQVYEAARTADAARIANEEEQADELAQDLATASDQLAISANWTKTQDGQRTAETNRLIAEANAPGTAPALALSDARKAALALSQTGGPWTQAAAIDALSGPDILATDFVRTGLAVAAGQDDRVTLDSLTTDATQGFRDAANAAMAGSDADVHAFLQSQDYPGRETDDRIAVDQIMAAARQNGSSATVAAGQKALDAGTDQALRQFLSASRYQAAANDERIKVNQIMAAATSGPELKAAAQVALDGTPGMIHQFLAVDQFPAAQRDQDSAAHNAEVAGYLAQAAQSAATASQNANDAQAAAATARGAAADAAGYAQQAHVDADHAAAFAQQAHQSALDAQDSATRAAQSAATARTAAATAQHASGQAARSAVYATSKAHQAAGFAADAYNSAQRAFEAAQRAGADARGAADAAHQAVDSAKGKIDQEKREAIADMAMYCARRFPSHSGPDFDDCVKFTISSDADKMQEYLSRGSLCDRVANAGMGEDYLRQCYRDVTSPSFGADQQLEIFSRLVNGLADLEEGILVIGGAFAAGIACAAIEPCGLLAASIIPEGTAFTSWLGITAGEAMLGTRIAAELEESSVAQIADDSFLADAAATARQLCATNSFTGDTPVLLAGGATKQIRDVRVGDAVVATDPAGGHTAAEPVTHVITGTGVKHLIDVRITGPPGTSVVHATYNHPFWVTDTKNWINAENLKAGTHLLTPDGEQAVVAGTRAHDETLTVYNLNVKALHTFSVLAGHTPVLVHNSECDDIALGFSEVDGNWEALKEFADDVSASYFRDWSDEKAWYEHVTDFLHDGTTRIHVSLDGMGDDAEINHLADIGETVNPSGYDNLTAWELAQIRNTPDAWDRVTFYRNGRPQRNPFDE